MKFTVKRTSDWDYKEEIEINTLKELIDFQKRSGCSDIIISDKYDEYRLEIYDTWRE